MTARNRKFLRQYTPVMPAKEVIQLNTDLNYKKVMDKYLLPAPPTPPPLERPQDIVPTALADAPPHEDAHTPTDVQAPPLLPEDPPAAVPSDHPPANNAGPHSTSPAPLNTHQK